MSSKAVAKLGVIIGALLILSLVSAWAASGFESLRGSLSFAILFIIGWAIVAVAWRSIQTEGPPAWLFGLLVGGALLRLGLGLFWFHALPLWGYDTETQQAGFIMEDAFNRETAAWNLAQSDAPLVVSFQGYSAYDQFGGLLFVDALVFRYLSPDVHIPQLTLVLAAVASGSGILFTWAFANRLWRNATAKLAAWTFALFPEAVLLGSTQMREAFTAALFAAAIYFLLRYLDSQRRADFLGLATALVVSFLFSVPVFTGIVLVGLLIAGVQRRIWEQIERKFIYWGVFLLAGALLAAMAIIDFQDIPFLTEVNRQVDQAIIESGWIERTFRGIPSWARLPFVIVYGIFRPLLPAALIATVDVPVLWRAITIWRALGWTAMLALLFYDRFLATRAKLWKQLPGVLLAYNWVMLLVVSYRGVGDNWDNPRYRVTFAGLQAGIVAWALVQKRSDDKWLGRIVFAAAAMVLWFVPWYMRRYVDFSWPVVDIWQTVGLGLVSAGLYILWDWSR
jgi:hypothetical protein